MNVGARTQNSGPSHYLASALLFVPSETFQIKSYSCLWSGFPGQSNFSLIILFYLLVYLLLSHKPIKVRTCSISQMGNCRPREGKRPAQGLELGSPTLRTAKEAPCLLGGGGALRGRLQLAGYSALARGRRVRSSVYQANCHPVV